MGNLDKLFTQITEKKKYNQTCGEARMIFHAWREDGELGYEILESSASCPSFEMMSKEEFEKGRTSQTLSEYYCDIWNEGTYKEEIVSGLVKELDIKEGEDRYFEWMAEYDVGESTQDYWGEWDGPEEFFENERWQEVSKEEYDRVYSRQTNIYDFGMPEELLKQTFRISYSPNCPKTIELRLVGKNGYIDGKKGSDIISFGNNISEAYQQIKEKEDAS